MIASVIEHSHSAAAAGRWSVAIALGGLLALPLLWSLLSIGVWWLRTNISSGTQSAKPKIRVGITSVVGADKRVSTSKTIAILWTYSVASAIFSLLVARWLGYPGAFKALEKQGLNAEYALLIGGPIGAAILAKGVITAQIAEGATAKPPAEETGPSDLLTNDAGNADLGDIQYVLFNFVALAFFWGEFMRVPTEGLPTIPDVLLGLTSVAAAGYVGKKALANAPAITAVLPRDSGRVGQVLRIFCSGLAKPGDDTTVITIRLGEAAFSPVALSATTTQGTILEGPIPADAAGAVELSVTSPTGTKAVWPNKYRIEPTIAIPAGAAPAQPGHSYIFETTAIVPLGPSFSDVAVTVAGVASPPGLDEGRFSVQIPPDLVAGTHPIVVVTPGGKAETNLDVA